MKKLLLLAVTLIAIAASSARANEFDQCILEHIKTATSDVAAKEIKKACVGMVSTPIPEAELEQTFHQARGYFSPNAWVGLGNVNTPGWVIVFLNGSDYDISNITIRLTDKEEHTQDYRLGPFSFTGSTVLPGGGILAGPPEDPTWNMKLGPGEHKFYISDVGGAIKDLSKVTSWSVVAANGWKRSASTNSSSPPNTCTQEELDFHPGDCWAKLSASEKRLTLMGLVYGLIYQTDSVRRYEYSRIGRSINTFFPSFNDQKTTTYLDQLYGSQENRTIRWSDSFDLAVRAQSNPETKDIPGLIALYRNHEEPLLSGYLRKFIPPNKVVISQYADPPIHPNLPNYTATITLLGISATGGNAKAVVEFMAALANVKRCNTLVRQNERHKFLEPVVGTTEEDKQNWKKLDELEPLQLAVAVQYPDTDKDQQEFFNAKNELSGVLLLNRGQTVCLKKAAGPALFSEVKLDQLMLDWVEMRSQPEYQKIFYENWYRIPLFDQSAAHDFINLNQYLVANGLRAEDSETGDPRRGASSYVPELYGPTPEEMKTSEGVKRILAVGAP